MANLPRRLSILLFVLFPCLISANDRLTCEKINSCSCRLSNGEIVDLSPLVYSELITSGENSVYQLFLCQPRQYGDDTSTCSPENDVAICQDLNVAEGVHIYYNWGRQYTAEFSVSNPYPLQIDILYTLGDSGRNSTVNVRCDEDSDGDLSFLGNYYDHSEFALHTKYGCPGYKENVSSVPVFFILLILGLFGFVLYFAIGAVVCWQMKGAKGLEMIPNFDFWKESPILFIDGFYLVTAPCFQCARDNLANRSEAYAKI